MIIKPAAILLLSTLVFAQAPTIRNERWGMTQDEVLAAEKTKPAKRNDHVLIYRDKEVGLPSQVIFEFTAGRLDQVSYVLDSPKVNPEVAFLTWTVDLTKRYGNGVLYLNGKPIGPPALMIDQGLKTFWKQKSGEILVVYPPKGGTYVGVGITMTKGQLLVEEDFTTTPRDGMSASKSQPRLYSPVWLLALPPR